MQSKAEKSGRPSEWKSESEKWNPQRKVTNIVDNTARSGADQSAPLKGEKYSTWPDVVPVFKYQEIKAPLWIYLSDVHMLPYYVWIWVVLIEYTLGGQTKILR